MLRLITKYLDYSYNELPSYYYDNPDSVDIYNMIRIIKPIFIMDDKDIFEAIIDWAQTRPQIMFATNYGPVQSIQREMLIHCFEASESILMRKCNYKPNGNPRIYPNL